MYYEKRPLLSQLAGIPPIKVAQKVVKSL